MVQLQYIVNSLPLPAAVPGRRYGVEMRIDGDEAGTDGKVIQLPTLPQNCDDELLLIVRGTIAHEPIHIRETDFALLRQETLPPG